MYENCMGNVCECIQICVPQVVFRRSLAYDYCAAQRTVKESCDYGAERRADGGPYDYGAERRTVLGDNIMKRNGEMGVVACVRLRCGTGVEMDCTITVQNR